MHTLSQETYLRVFGALFGLSSFLHHLLKVSAITNRVLVAWLTWVYPGSIRSVAFVSLERIKVLGRARLVRVPRIVNVFLGLIVEKLIIVLPRDPV